MERNPSRYTEQRHIDKTIRTADKFTTCINSVRNTTGKYTHEENKTRKRNTNKNNGRHTEKQKERNMKDIKKDINKENNNNDKNNDIKKYEMK